MAKGVKEKTALVVQKVYRVCASHTAGDVDVSIQTAPRELKGAPCSARRMVVENDALSTVVPRALREALPSARATAEARDAHFQSARRVSMAGLLSVSRMVAARDVLTRDAPKVHVEGPISVSDTVAGNDASLMVVLRVPKAAPISVKHMEEENGVLGDNPDRSTVTRLRARVGPLLGVKRVFVPCTEP